MGVKISDLTAKGSDLSATDLLEVAVVSGPSYVSRSITGDDIISLTLYGGDGTLNGNRTIDANDNGIEFQNLDYYILSINALGGATNDLHYIQINPTNITAGGRMFTIEDINASKRRFAILKDGNVQINEVFKFPLVDGSNGQTLRTNGSGTLTWQDDLYVTKNTQTTNYVLDLTDDNKLVEMNLATANTLTIPTNTVVAFPIGTQILIAQYGAGQTTVTAAVGVTLRSSGGKTKIAAQYGLATLIKRDTNEWYLAGDITT